MTKFKAARCVAPKQSVRFQGTRQTVCRGPGKAGRGLQLGETTWRIGDNSHRDHSLVEHTDASLWHGRSIF